MRQKRLNISKAYKKKLQDVIPVDAYLFKNSSPVYTIICGHVSVQTETSQQTDAHIDELHQS